MISVEVAHIFLVENGKEFIILLRGKEHEKSLPIAIGYLEAQSIAMQLNGIQYPRPLTHDLFVSVLRKIDIAIDRIEVKDLIDNTFYARLILKSNERNYDIDARPSDAIALALRYSAPIFVDETVMEQAGIVFPEDAIEEKIERDGSKG
jgi:hypothetical protein